MNDRRVRCGRCAIARLALKGAATEQEAVAAVRASFAGVTRIADALDLLLSSSLSPYVPASDETVAQALLRFGHDPIAMAEAVEHLEDAPRALVLPFATVLLQLESRHPEIKPPEVLAALRLAKRLIPAHQRRALGLPAPAVQAKDSLPKPAARRSKTATLSAPQPVKPAAPSVDGELLSLLGETP